MQFFSNQLLPHCLLVELLSKMLQKWGLVLQGINTWISDHCSHVIGQKGIGVSHTCPHHKATMHFIPSSRVGSKKKARIALEDSTDQGWGGQEWCIGDVASQD